MDASSKGYKNNNFPHLCSHGIPVYTKTVCVFISHWKNDKMKHAYKRQLAKFNLFFSVVLTIIGPLK